MTKSVPVHVTRMAPTDATTTGPGRASRRLEQARPLPAATTMDVIQLMQDRELVLKRRIELRTEVARAIRARRESRALVDAARGMSERLAPKAEEPKR